MENNRKTYSLFNRLMKSLLLSFLLFCGCQKSLFSQGEVLGADEFVMESYEIKEEPLSHATIHIQGAVKQRGPIAIEKPLLTLKEALMKAGGMTYEGDKKQIYIQREDREGRRSFLVTWEHIETLPPESLLLKGGDIVRVEPLAIFRMKKREE